MRIASTSISMPNTIPQSAGIQTTQPESVDIPQPTPQEPERPAEQDANVQKGKLQQAIDSINEFFTINQSELKFVLHEGFGEYFAQLVNSETDEVIREIPSKKMLDVFYEMQKLVGLIVDKKI